MCPQIMSPHSIIITPIFLISIIIPASYGASYDEKLRNCSGTRYNCGSLNGIGYPFWGRDRPEYCGPPEFGLFCHDNQTDPYTVLSNGNGTSNQLFRVLEINQSNSIHTMTVVRNDLWFNNACLKLSNVDPADLKYKIGTKYAKTVEIVNVFYGCNSRVMPNVEAVISNITCLNNGGVIFFAGGSVTSISGCNYSTAVPVLSRALNRLRDGTMTVQEALNQGFDMDYYDTNLESCEASGGTSGFDNSTLKFVCLCRDKAHPLACPRHGTRHYLKLEIGASAVGMGILLTSIILWRYKRSSDNSIFFWMNTNYDQNLENFVRQYGSLGLKRYSYSDVKKMTNSLREKLGQGGYGGVYKGRLLDDRVVAVKILNASKGNGEEFINEVASISRTSHVNVVNLLGFCLEGHKRALIYEFMPNGSLEKFIYGESPLKTGRHLGWEKLYHISIGIARGLEYLHRGCNTRILHLDIKPHNILLDEEFVPKISDFGLAKLCSRKESIVSMLEARGTIGYIAPEVFNRNFGGVSNKSDVYSYGMMVLEMVGGRKNIDAGVSHSSKIYFPHWVYQRLELNEDLEFQDIMVQEEYEIAKKMVLTGLWCIQTDPSRRPSMNKVIEMLEGSIEALQIPPKPFICSPSRSAADSSSTNKLMMQSF